MITKLDLASPSMLFCVSFFSNFEWQLLPRSRSSFYVVQSMQAQAPSIPIHRWWSLFQSDGSEASLCQYLSSRENRLFKASQGTHDNEIFLLRLHKFITVPVRGVLPLNISFVWPILAGGSLNPSCHVGWVGLRLQHSSLPLFYRY